MDKFICQKCGNCCKSFKIEDQELYPNFMKNSNILSFSSPRLLIFDWEKDFFPEKNLVIGNAFFDLKNNTLIILNYNLNEDICPNTENNICKIHVNRPLSCRLYPCPYRDVEDTMVIQSAFGICPAELKPESFKEQLGENTSKEKIRKKLLERYNDGFTQGIISNILLENYIKFLVNLEKQGLIKLAKEGYKIDFLKKRIDENKKVNISDLFYKYNKYHLHKMLVSKESIEKINNKIRNS